jgi:hypothetical protein
MDPFISPVYNYVPYLCFVKLSGISYSVTMKYQLETIPVCDAYEEEGECPLCILEEKAEKRYIDFFLGSSVMAPEMRVQVNKSGFCPHHLTLLFKGKNRLGLALMAQTHLHELIERLGPLQKRLLNKAGLKGPGQKKDSPGPYKKRMSNSFVNFIEARRTECLICDRMKTALKRYAFTLVYLWQKDDEFREIVKSSRGFCLHHLGLVIEMAEEILSRKKLGSWLQEVLPLQMKNLKRLEEAIYTFSRTFDHQSDAGNAEKEKDTLRKTLQKISGKLFNNS